MKETFWFLLFFSYFYGAVPSMQQPTDQVEELQVIIAAPLSGEALQGVVEIQGTSAVPGFQAAEVSFGYQSDPTNTWFLIQQNSQPIQEGRLASWDTTTITDGEYRLRLQVFLQDGQVIEQVATGLRVRNYTPVETSTPVVLPTGQTTPTFTPTPLMDFGVTAPVQTPLPTNPAQLTPRLFSASILQGVLFVFAVFFGSGIYLGLRWLIRR